MMGRFGWRALFRSWSERQTDLSVPHEETSPTANSHANGFDLVLPSGRLRAHRFGDPRGRLVLCVPGLSSTSRTFDYIGEGLAGEGLHIVALDLRGRGHSEVTRPTTYGWGRHAQDLLDAATALGATTFEVIGHSMGAYVALHAARLAPRRVGRIVLIDGGGIPRYAAFRAILRGVERLDMSYGTADEYIDAVRALGFVTPWNEYWERAFRYDLHVIGDRVRPRTSSVAVFEDVVYGASHDPRILWHGVEMPALILRAAIPLVSSDGFVLTAFDVENFLRAVPSARGMDVNANHFGIMMHPQTVDAIRLFAR
jgi:pimeloyl-ACP methyl ester carboxylesterase